MDSGDSNTLLDLDPENVVFYVGGYPSDFRVSVNVFSRNENIWNFIWHNDVLVGYIQNGFNCVFLQDIQWQWLTLIEFFYVQWSRLKYINLNKHHYLSYFTDEETETERLNNLPKITQLENSKARVSGSRVPMLTRYVTLMVKSDRVILFPGQPVHCPLFN